MDNPEFEKGKNLLERVAFERTLASGQKVYLIADAYRGDRMKECLEDLFGAISGRKKGKTRIENEEFHLYNQADLIAFSGHNGLMDVDIPPPSNIDGIYKDVAVIGCISYDYFKGPLAKAGGFPLVTTTGLMAPEAYVLEGIFNAWAEGQAPAEIRMAAARKYHEYQKCGLKGATRLFKTGW